MEMELAERLYRLMFTNMREGLAILRVDPEDPEGSPVVIEMNPAAVKLCRCRSFNFANCKTADCFPGWFDEERLRETCRRLAAFGGMVDLGEVSSGAFVYRARIFGLSEEHLGLVIDDVTRLKKGEAELARVTGLMEQQSAAVEKRVAERTAQLQEINEELDSFAYSVSHDLRAPLRAMRAFAGILLEEEHTEAERVAYLKRIQAASEGMERLIQDLLAYSRVGRQEIVLQRVSLDLVVADAAKQLELTSGGKSYRLEVRESLPEVVGHHTVLVQVVLNIMGNSIKFVPKGVVPSLLVWGEELDGECRLNIADNGIGIAPEHQERIFKIFERLHGIESYPGTGIGLAIARKAVTRLGGRIGVESMEGEGSRFWIVLKKAGPPS
ncbi:histidine kinase [Geoanaerobacter pelophilus]|uniref:histidine kinase n=1 Tax=Geoanaerobacter pelophilus TaxID=60036 RepID=A0ABQ0MH46_9BACT|nr:ATP-binding protein [Geoanaerobacter pelophilus]GAW66408.1 histidine kinase [Geoanaerobacter pelophilus]